MARLRHIALQVPDLEKAVGFYEAVFGLERVRSTSSAESWACSSGRRRRRAGR